MNFETRFIVLCVYMCVAGIFANDDDIDNQDTLIKFIFILYVCVCTCHGNAIRFSSGNCI